jgi:hypothetical protein
VLRTIHVLMHRGGIVKEAHITEVGILAMYLSAIIHDFEHIGLTNEFLMKTQNELAVRYNDRSPMENHHVSSAWSALRAEKHFFLEGMPQKALDFLRKTVIEIVLATDMKQHFSLLSVFQSKAAVVAAAHANSRPSSRPSSRPNSRPVSAVDVGNGGGGGVERSNPPSLLATKASSSTGSMKLWDEDGRLLAVQMAMKAADLGHLASAIDCHMVWVKKLEQEMFKQGDKERELGLPVSPLMDRHSGKGVTKSQTGFYSFVALPLYQSISSAFPDVLPFFDLVKANHQYWTKVEQMEQLQEKEE